MARWASFFADKPKETLYWANFVAHTGTAAWPYGSSGALRTSNSAGFAALEAGCRRVVVLMTPFPPFGGGEITV